MKSSGLLFMLIFFSFSLSAQNRYQHAVFAEYDSVMNIKYGANINATGIEENLLLNIYMPKGDTLSNRPVIFFTHGGSFMFGSKEDGDVAHFCRYFAKRGYVTVSQNYRLGFESFDPTGAKRTVWRAVKDGRAAVRFMRSKADEYSLDTNMFVYGGSSAGGFIGLHLAFYDKPSELLEGTDTLELGGFEGHTNHLGNSSKVQGVINLCGAIGDTSWIEPKDSIISLMSMHGNKDATVPYHSNIIYLLGFIPLLEVDGSSSIRERENSLNFHNRFYTYCGMDHVPYAYDLPEGRRAMDTTLALINQFMYEDVLKLGVADIRIEDADSVDCPGITGIRNLALMSDIKIYPNPASDRIFIESPASYQRLEVEILDASGKKIYASHFKTDQINSIDIQPFKSGVYLVIIRSDEKVSLKKMIKK